MEKAVRLCFLGPPGAGKGTQAEMVSAHFHIPHISTGDMLREAVREQTELGKRAQAIMERGELVPDDVVTGIVRERLERADCRPGFVLDGFPRTVVQANALQGILEDLHQPLERVLNLIVPDDIIVLRSTGRRVCRQCGANYHLVFNPPAVPDRCDLCGGELYQRDDDREATVRRRLAVYAEQTAPLVDYYRARGLLRDVDGNAAVDTVFTRVLAAI